VGIKEFNEITPPSPLNSSPHKDERGKDGIFV